MNARARIIGMSIIGATVALLLWQAQAGRAQGPQPQAPQAALGTAFTYQGQLKKNGAPYNGSCNFQFSLWDDPSAGAQQGITQTLNGVNVGGGVFSATLDFGAQFTGDARWLQTAVQCTGDGGFTPLAGRTGLAPVPYALYAPVADAASTAKSADTAVYALSLAPGSVISGTGVLGLQVNTPNGNAIVGTSAANGYATIYGADSSATGGYGVYGNSANGTGVYGNSTNIYGVHGDSANGTGVHGNSTSGYGVLGNSPNGTGVYGNSTSSYGVHGNSTNYTGAGVRGDSTSGNGVEGRSNSSWGVYGYSVGSVGVSGYGGGGIGVYGATVAGMAGYFAGPVQVNGWVTKTGGSFLIDHPLDPANKYLAHSFVESPDMLNVYNGNITTDAHGDATIMLPAYFEALNKDFRYQLTVIGTFAQAIVAEEIAGNQFSIKTDKPRVKVSWQVTGIRKDPFAETHRLVPETDKPAKERGQYLYPELYGQPAEKGVGYEMRQRALEGGKR